MSQIISTICNIITNICLVITVAELLSTGKTIDELQDLMRHDGRKATK